MSHSLINNENNHINNSGWIKKPDFKQYSPAFGFHVQIKGRVPHYSRHRRKDDKLLTEQY